METTTTAPLNPPSRRHLWRWNTIATSAATRRSFRSAASPSPSASDDLELLPMITNSASHTYSSLRDLLPPHGAVNSPKVKSRSEICIRNRLVKQAARAYLSPMLEYPSSGGGGFFRRLWTGVAALIDFFCTKAVRILDGALRAVRIRSSGSRMCLI